VKKEVDFLSAHELYTKLVKICTEEFDNDFKKQGA